MVPIIAQGGSNLGMALTILIYYGIFYILPVIVVASALIFFGRVFWQSFIKNPFKTPKSPRH